MSNHYTHLPTIEDQKKSSRMRKLNNISISNPSQDPYFPELPSSNRRGGSMTNRMASAREKTLSGIGDQYSPQNGGGLGLGMRSRDSSHLELI